MSDINDLYNEVEMLSVKPLIEMLEFYKSSHTIVTIVFNFCICYNCHNYTIVTQMLHFALVETVTLTIVSQQFFSTRKPSKH